MKWTSDYLDFEKDNPIYGISKNELWGIVDFTSTNSKLYICYDIVNKKRSKQFWGNKKGKCTFISYPKAIHFKWLVIRRFEWTDRMGFIKVECQQNGRLISNLSEFTL